MANELKNLLDKQIHLKLASMPKPLACTVSSIESVGLWVSGAPILQAVVQAGAGGAPIQNPVIFVPFENIEWLLAASV
jgi:hypothetical protein